MQVSSTAGLSTAAAMRSLFPPPQKERQDVPSAGQNVPTSSSSAAKCTGSIQMSSNMLSSLLGLQSQGGQGPDLGDMAQSMIQSLDTNGDGVVSAEEAAAFGASNGTDAFTTLDANGDGSLTYDDVTFALQEMGPPPGGPPSGGLGMMSSSDIASSILSNMGGSGSSGLSLQQFSDALGSSSSTTDVSDGFSRLDSNGDGTLSQTELAAAIDQYMQGVLSSYRSTDTSTSSGVTA